ncbi:MAG: Substrate-binding region of ABC-type glycine betaine transport system [Moorella sp. 60_41]|nr:MAG: Substrate-binding region of ABC-type glycine betaine transport system [Moorella sp. 60_41]
MKRVMSKYGIIWLISLLLLLPLLSGCSGGQAAQAPGAIDKWVFATDHEFSVRPDGLPELLKFYGFEFDEVRIMDLGVTYGALKDGQVAAAMGFATDGRIAAFDLVNLEDDKNFFPVYNPAPVVRKDFLDRYPELEELLGRLSPLLDTETMISLNAQVDVENKDPKEVARQWLLEQGLIREEASAPTKGKIVVGSKEFTEQLILGAITIQVLADAGFEAVDSTGLAGSEVVRKALTGGEIDVYWEYTGTAWLVHLGHDDPLTDSEECYNLVKEEDLARYNLVWLAYAPFDNTYTIMMRKADADALGIKTISDLARVINEGKN